MDLTVGRRESKLNAKSIFLPTGKAFLIGSFFELIDFTDTFFHSLVYIRSVPDGPFTGFFDKNPFNISTVLFEIFRLFLPNTDPPERRAK